MWKAGQHSLFDTFESLVNGLCKNIIVSWFVVKSVKAIPKSYVSQSIPRFEESQDRTFSKIQLDILLMEQVFLSDLLSGTYWARVKEY